jgi:acylphosphatase
MTRRRVVVTGRVQGVFFRDSVRRLAESRDVAGWVRNNADGSVEAVFEGEEGAVASMVAFCRHGPRGADVAASEETEEEPQGESGFRIV